MRLARKIADMIWRDSAPARCLRRDASTGHAFAQSALGDMYRKGKLVLQNYADAAKWYRLAAEQGDAHAQFNLGACYTAGRGVPQDDAEAVKRYRLAAEQGGFARAVQSRRDVFERPRRSEGSDHRLHVVRFVGRTRHAGRRRKLPDDRAAAQPAPSRAGADARRRMEGGAGAA